MRTVSTIFAMAMVASLGLVVACTSKSDDDGGTSKKDGGGDDDDNGDDDDDDTDDLCTTACETAAEVECDKASTCAADCKSTRAKVPSACKADDKALWECAAKAGADDYECSETTDKPTLKDDVCKDEFDAFLECVAKNSKKDGGADGGGEDCQTCLTTECATETATCQANADCLDLLDCAAACDVTDQDCLDTCSEAHPDGVEDAEAVGACGQTNCEEACSEG